jgi:signal transduction histidine kinase
LTPPEVSALEVIARSGLGFADSEDENALLAGVVEAISAGPELGPVAARIAGLIVAATATDVCFVHVLDDSGAALTLAGATPPFDAAVGSVRLLVGEGVSGWVARHGEPVTITDGKQGDPRYRYFPGLHGEEFTSMASVPMASRPSGLVGVLNVHTRSRRIFTERDVVLLTTIGSLVAGAVHQARLHRQLAAREHAHERFAERVIAAQEAERRRLAADIHDGISQRLISLSYHLDAAADALWDAPEFTGEQLVLARQMIDLTLNEARAAISGLRPPVLDDLGLADSLASLARSIHAVQVTVDADDCALPEHVEIALYRIAQEALQNVVKHAGATAASVVLRCDPGMVSLRIADDGAGFDLEGAGDRSGFGLRGMAERADLVGGRLDVLSDPGRGTTIEARVPGSAPPGEGAATAEVR